MGLFSRKSSSPAAAAPVSAPTPQYRLVDPGLPATHARQVGYEVLVGTGLGIALCGPGDVADCFRAAAAVSPVLLDSDVIGAGFGSLAQDAGVWMAWSAPSGSAVVYCAVPDSDAGFVLHHFSDPMVSARGRFEGGLICLGESSDAQLVEIINTGDVVPVWDLPGLEHHRPAAAEFSQGYRALREAVRDTLVANGGEQIEGGLVRAVIGTGDGRTQLVLVALDTAIHVLSPIARTVDGALPAVLRSLDPGPYGIDVIADLVMLTHRVEDRVPMDLTADDVIAKAVELGRYADSVEANISVDDDL